MTADAAVQGIRQVDPTGSIGLVSSEVHAPYDRPPLTKGLWKGTPLATIWRKDAVQEATLHLGRSARLLDPAQRRVTDDHGATYRYEKLLLATGGSPRRLPHVADSDSILYYRTLDDYQRLRALVDGRQRFAVVGGGFIGSEIAAALALNGKDVIMVFPGPAIGAGMFPPDLAEFLTGYYRSRGVEVRTGEEVVEIKTRTSGCLLKTRSAGRLREIAAEAVVAGIGIRPNVELAEQAGLDLGDGIRVDSALRTSDPNIFAAGDVAEFFCPALRTSLRVEHEDNAKTMGEMAGESMAGQAVCYEHLPMFYSDLFDLGYEAVGQIDSRLEMEEDWKEPHREGVVYYLRQGRLRGALMWNVWDRVDAARRLIAESGPCTPDELRGQLLDAHQRV
jgi:NADPH-dependent 2,4-dienoyl-CoA reductase/sulfur reductase-like enzyme